MKRRYSAGNIRRSDQVTVSIVGRLRHWEFPGAINRQFLRRLNDQYRRQYFLHHAAHVVEHGQSASTRGIDRFDHVSRRVVGDSRHVPQSILSCHDTPHQIVAGLSDSWRGSSGDIGWFVGCCVDTDIRRRVDYGIGDVARFYHSSHQIATVNMCQPNGVIRIGQWHRFVLQPACKVVGILSDRTLNILCGDRLTSGVEAGRRGYTSRILCRFSRIAIVERRLCHSLPGRGDRASFIDGHNVVGQ